MFVKIAAPSIDFLILVSDTARMTAKKAASTAANPCKDWQKTQFANLVRYVPSGMFFARIRVTGKLIRRSLKTDVLSVAKLRLGDLDKQERQHAESTDDAARGKMTVADAIAMLKLRVAGDASLKPRTKDYHDQRITALLKATTRPEAPPGHHQDGVPELGGSVRQVRQSQRFQSYPKLTTSVVRDRD